MVAGLQVDVQRGVAGGSAGRLERVDLGMRPAGEPVVALADHRRVFDHHGTHHGVGRGEAPALRRQIEGHLHVMLVVHGANRDGPKPKCPPTQPTGGAPCSDGRDGVAAGFLSTPFHKYGSV